MHNWEDSGVYVATALHAHSPLSLWNTIQRLSSAHDSERRWPPRNHIRSSRTSSTIESCSYAASLILLRLSHGLGCSDSCGIGPQPSCRSSILRGNRLLPGRPGHKIKVLWMVHSGRVGERCVGVAKIVCPEFRLRWGVSQSSLLFSVLAAARNRSAGARPRAAKLGRVWFWVAIIFCVVGAHTPAHAGREGRRRCRNGAWRH